MTANELQIIYAFCRVVRLLAELPPDLRGKLEGYIEGCADTYNRNVKKEVFSGTDS